MYVPSCMYHHHSCTIIIPVASSCMYHHSCSIIHVASCMYHHVCIIIIPVASFTHLMASRALKIKFINTWFNIDWLASTGGSRRPPLGIISWFCRNTIVMLVPKVPVYLNQLDIFYSLTNCIFTICILTNSIFLHFDQLYIVDQLINCIEETAPETTRVRQGHRCSCTSNT